MAPGFEPSRPLAPARAGRLVAWLPPALWAAVLFALSSVPGSEVPAVPVPFADKLEHGFVYGILGLLCFRALRSSRLSVARMILVGTAIALGYGISDEVHQLFVPGRSADPRDVAADVTGGCIGALLGGWRARERARRRQQPKG